MSAAHGPTTQCFGGFSSLAGFRAFPLFVIKMPLRVTLKDLEILLSESHLWGVATVVSVAVRGLLCCGCSGKARKEERAS